MNCLNKGKNSDFCTCTYSSCPRKGICCECIRYHLSQDQVPACFFPPAAEKTYDRSLEHYISVSKKK